MPAKKENGALPTERSSSVDGKKPCVPMIPLPSPNASAKPTAQYTSEQIPKMSTFLPAMCAAFFIRVRPASRKANPACMNITSTAATTTQTVFAAISRSEVFIRFAPQAHELERRSNGQTGLGPVRAQRGARASEKEGGPAGGPGVHPCFSSDDNLAFEALPGAIVRHARNRRSPDEAVARLVAASRRIRHS